MDRNSNFQIHSKSWKPRVLIVTISANNLPNASSEFESMIDLTKY